MSEPRAVYEAERRPSVRERPGRRALEVLEFVCRFKESHGGDSPSREEIAAGVGLASKSTVHVHLATLERYGLIRRGARDARRIEVVGGEWRLRGQPWLLPQSRPVSHAPSD